MSDLDARIAKALGWSIADTRLLSMYALRDLVRTVNPTLAQEMSVLIQSGVYTRGVPEAPKVAASKEERGAKVPKAVAAKKERGPKKIPVSLPFERKPQIPSRWHDRYRKEIVPINRMIATQSYVTEKGVRHHRTTAAKHDIDLPLVYRTDDGRLYIADGHHRIVAAIRRGDANVRARVIDIGDPDAPQEPSW